LRQLLSPHRATRRDGSAEGGHAGCRITITYRTSHGPPGARCEIDLGDEWRVMADDALVGGLGDWLAPENVQIDYG
jgi:hypothetical protein